MKDILPKRNDIIWFSLLVLFITSVLFTEYHVFKSCSKEILLYGFICVTIICLIFNYLVNKFVNSSFIKINLHLLCNAFNFMNIYIGYVFIGKLRGFVELNYTMLFTTCFITILTLQSCLLWQQTKQVNYIISRRKHKNYSKYLQWFQWSFPPIVSVVFLLVIFTAKNKFISLCFLFFWAVVYLEIITRILNKLKFNFSAKILPVYWVGFYFVSVVIYVFLLFSSKNAVDTVILWLMWSVIALIKIALMQENSGKG